MANLSFFALKEDFIKIFDFIFSETDIIVYEDYSRYNSEIRQFHNTEVLFKAYTIGQDLHGNRSIVLALYSPSVMAKPIIDKIDLGKGEFRYNIEGWPIIRLHLGGKYKNSVILSEFSHNSIERAKKWALSYGNKMDKTSDTDWIGLQKLSNKIQYYIRKKLVVAKVAGHGILEEAYKSYQNGDKLKYLGDAPMEYDTEYEVKLLVKGK